MNRQKGFINIAYIIAVVALIGAGSYFLVRKTNKPSAPTIEYISPTEAPIGAVVSIAGSGFTLTDNSLQFGTGFAYLNNLSSSDGKMMTFTLPESFDTCRPNGGACAELLSLPVPGQMYKVKVINVNGESNSVDFTVARSATPKPTPAPGPTACTADVKQCPDGSYVGRSGPNCTFPACPSPLPPGPQVEQVSLREGQRESSFLLEKIYTDRVTGINFGEYPVSTDQGYPITLRIGEVVSNGCTITLTLTKIEGKVATFMKRTDLSKPCPICLAQDTLIDTPSGAVPVQNLQKGMAIWTLDRLGKRVFAVVVEIAKTPVPPTHQVIRLILNDGREVFVSGGHPTIDGQKVQDLSIGDTYDGSVVLSAKSVPYRKQATYDVLPSGETGFYWANGVLLGSTLKNH